MPLHQSTRPGADLLHDVRSVEALREEILEAFSNVDEARSGEIMNEALSLYPVEDVCLHLLQPALIEVGEMWLDGKISVAVEHFASSFVRSRLSNLFHSSPHNTYGPLVLVGCAPEEFHELGAMFLSLFLRRAGFRVVYLGQNVPLESLQGMIHAMRPNVVCISATRAETASSLYSLRDFLDTMERKQGSAPLLAYGGRIFNRYPHITERLGGLYLGEDASEAVRKLSEKLRVSSGGQ
jgi:methanogenic corrinoid protein MtbC1